MAIRKGGMAFCDVMSCLVAAVGGGAFPKDVKLLGLGYLSLQ
jgi:hypothetical protein